MSQIGTGPVEKHFWLDGKMWVTLTQADLAEDEARSGGLTLQLFDVEGGPPVLGVPRDELTAWRKKQKMCG